MERVVAWVVVPQPAGGKAVVNQPRSPTLPLASFPRRKKQSSQNNAVILAA